MSSRHQTKLAFFGKLDQLGLSTISNFHALPISNYTVLKDSAFEHQYKRLLTNKASMETTITAPFLDSLACSSKEIAESQRIAARLFNSDQTLFVTSGSTVSNQIAVAACCGKSTRTLVQKGMHQSFHFSLMAAEVPSVFVDDVEISERTGSTAIDLAVILQELQEAEKQGSPFTVLILNSQSYDGVIHKLDSIFEKVAVAGPSLRHIIVDEAWGAWSGFDQTIRKHTAIPAANNLRKNYKIDIVVTQSAHKSLFALRQASLLHCIGSEETQKNLSDQRYRLHTTSPSYPILASLELCIHQAAAEGQRFSSNCRKLTQNIEKIIQKDLKRISIIKLRASIRSDIPAVPDPTKLWINTKGIGITGEKLRRVLFEEFRIYTSRYSKNALLINIHFGISQKEVKKLINALIEIESKFLNSSEMVVENQEISQEFIIPYPPGVPLVVPGDTMTTAIVTKINQASAAGVHLLYIAR